MKTRNIKPTDACIVGRARTPLGSYGGVFKDLSAPDLCAIAIKGALKNANISPELVEEVFIGNVLSANIGQAPATQASLKAGIPETVPTTTINKVCASGMKAIMLGASFIELGKRHVVVAGGMESMSNVPYYLPNQRFGRRLGHDQVIDGMIKDGLTDAYNHQHMGMCAEKCAETFNISRKEQDDYAINSYKRSKESLNVKEIQNEIVPVEVINAKKNKILITKDEEIDKVNYEKLRTLRPAFKKGGTVTAGNASVLSDGAAAIVIVSGEFAIKNNLTVEAIIRGYDDAQQQPEWFTTTPAKAIEKTLKSLNLSTKDIDLYEINEAFSVVALANMKLLNIEHSKVNVFGGAVSLGHPLGCSGCRIVVTLLSALKHKNGRFGCASICNGGGGASCIVIERPNVDLRSNL